MQRFKTMKPISIWIPSLGLGDTVCATPVVRKIRDMYPDRVLEVYSYYPEVFVYNPYVTHSRLFEEALELNGHYTEIRKHEHDRWFSTFFSTENKPVIDHATNSIMDVCSLIALNTRLADCEKWPEIYYTAKEKQSLLKKLDNKPKDFSKTVVIHPSKTWASRTWPFEQWQALTDLLIHEGFEVIAAGKSDPVLERRRTLPGEENMGMQVCPKGAINLIDQLSILETVCLCSLSLGVITVDTGLMHLALSTDTNVVGIFTVIDPKYRQVFRHGSFDFKIAAVVPQGECRYCTVNRKDKSDGLQCCVVAKVPTCMPGAGTVFSTFQNLIAWDHNHLTQRSFMENQNVTVNPDVVCQQALQAQLESYRAREAYDVVLKKYSDTVDMLVQTVNLMKNRIIELENQIKESEAKKAQKAA